MYVVANFSVEGKMALTGRDAGVPGDQFFVRSLGDWIWSPGFGYNLDMRMVALQSGSNGNSIYVEASGVRLLIDAGISGIQMQQRLATHGIDAADIDALLISHDHRDHVRCMGVYHRTFRIPVYVTERTLMTARRRLRLGTINDIHIFSAGAALEFGPVTVETMPTPHDGVDGVGFLIDDGQSRLGVLTDLGHVFDGLSDAMRSLDAVLVESNYEPELLDFGPYPEFLKDRIRGPAGHLSNHETAELLRGAFRSRLKWACLGHLSEHNNEPRVALETNQAMIGSEYRLAVASRYAVSGVFDV